MAFYLLEAGVFAPGRIFPNALPYLSQSTAAGNEFAQACVELAFGQQLLYREVHAIPPIVMGRGWYVYLLLAGIRPTQTPVD